MRFLIPVLGTLLMIAACQSNTQDALYEEVMKIHDDVMPKVADISRLSLQLKKEKKSIPDSVSVESYDDIISELDGAEKAMYDWMRDFKLPENDSEKSGYLEKEKVAIEKVRDRMLESITRANKFLENENK